MKVTLIKFSKFCFLTIFLLVATTFVRSYVLQEEIRLSWTLLFGYLVIVVGSGIAYVKFL